MRRVLITGANGFIGSNLCRAFLEGGWQVHALVRESSDVHFLEGVPVLRVQGDLLRPERIDLPRRLDCIVHAAALASDLADDASARRGILEPTVAFVEMLIARGQVPRRFLYISSTLVLGLGRRGISESHPGRPAGLPYARAKAETERYLLEQHRTRGFPVVILRPADVYGPRDRTSCLLILAGIDRGVPPIVGRGNHVFPMCYIDNLAQACRLVCEGRGIEGRAYTVADGEEVTWRRFFGGFLARLGRRQRIYVPAAVAYAAAAALQLLHFIVPSYDPPLTIYRIRRVTSSTTYDISDTVRELGFRPDRDLDRQIDSIVSWYLAEKRAGQLPRLLAAKA